MSFIRNDKDSGVYWDNANKVEYTGPKLVNMENIPLNLTNQEKYNLGLITLDELRIFNLSFEDILRKQA